MKRNSLTTFALGLGTGVLAGLLLDPEAGPRRRSYVRDKAVHTLRGLNRWSVRTRRLLRNRLTGFYYEMAKASEGYREVDDITLEQRVRSQMGHRSEHAHAVTVDVADGVVVLSGSVPRSDICEIVDCVENTKGVRDVINKLQVQASPELVTNLPG